MAIRPFRTRETIRAQALNELVNGVNVLQPGVAPTARFQRPATKGSAAQVRLATITVLANDYLICSVARGSREGLQFYVAKPPYLRLSLSAHADLAFTYSDSNTRTAGDGVDSENQELVPPYTVGDEIAAIGPVSTGVVAADNSEATWLDINIWARMWGVAPE